MSDVRTNSLAMFTAVTLIKLSVNNSCKQHTHIGIMALFTFQFSLTIHQTTISRNQSVTSKADTLSKPTRKSFDKMAMYLSRLQSLRPVVETRSDDIPKFSDTQQFLLSNIKSTSCDSPCDFFNPSCMQHALSMSSCKKQEIYLKITNN